MNNKIKKRLKQEEAKDKILKLLNSDDNGLTIQEISDKSKIPRSTVVLVLAELKGQKRIKIREVGNAKLHYLK